jgi:hypothetical protein
VLVVPFPFHVSLHVYRPVSPLFRLESRKEEPSTEIIFLQVRKEKTKRITTLPFLAERYGHMMCSNLEMEKRETEASWCACWTLVFCLSVKLSSVDGNIPHLCSMMFSICKFSVESVPACSVLQQRHRDCYLSK